MKRLKKIAFWFFAILIAFVLGVWVYLLNLKPDYSGTLDLEGLTESVEVYFDEWGIPHIYAQNEHDAQLALGYVHAQDRLFQMEMMRRVGWGRLSELLGEDLVQTDKFFRAIGLTEAAHAAAEKFDPEKSHVDAMAQAYLDGINEYMHNGSTPIEFRLLGIEKEDFVPADMFVISGYMAYTFAAAFRMEPQIDKIYQKYGLSYLEDLGIKHMNSSATIPVHYADSTNYSEHEFATEARNIFKNLPVPMFYGSNSWVIAPEKTKLKKVLFSNDTHIGYAQPAVWYEAHINYPGFSFYGNYLAGIPFGLVGHNDFSAFGMTMFENDDIDFFREKRNPENENQVWENDKWVDLTSTKHTIKVKDAEAIEFEVKISRHGPIINEALAKLKSEEAPISMWWVYTKFDNRLLEAFYKLDHCQSLEEANEAASLIYAPGLNVMYGDSDGNIAWWAAAKLVKRAEHVNSRLILDGASGADEYTGYYDFSQNPQSINPPEGFVYSANNQPDTIAGILYPGYYAPEHRAMRINQFLKNKDDWTFEEMQTMVTDVISPMHAGLSKLLMANLNKENLPENGNHQKIVALLTNWDGDHQMADIEPTLYYKLLYNVLHNIFVDELGEEDFEGFASSHTIENTYPYLFANDSSVWWDNIETEAKETRAEIIEKSFIKTVDDLEKQLGTDMQQWQWSKVHTLEHVHPIGRKEPFNKLFNVGPFHVMGGNQVINNIDFHIDSTGLYKATYGPAIRIQIDFADMENSISILPTGESGRFMSPHYNDQAEMYNTGQFRKQKTNKEEIIKTAKGKLILK